MSSGFNFVPYQNVVKTKGDRATVWVTKNHVSIGRVVYEELGNPPRVRVYFDSKAKAIKLEAAVDGLVAHSTKTRRATQLNVAGIPNTGTPAGDYLPIGGGIFVHESTQR